MRVKVIKVSNGYPREQLPRRRALIGVELTVTTRYPAYVLAKTGDDVSWLWKREDVEVVLPSAYGGLGDLHPTRDKVVSEALERFEAGSATDVDLFVLWADVAISELL